MSFLRSDCNSWVALRNFSLVGEIDKLSVSSVEWVSNRNQALPGTDENATKTEQNKRPAQEPTAPLSRQAWSLEREMQDLQEGKGQDHLCGFADWPLDTD